MKMKHSFVFGTLVIALFFSACSNPANPEDPEFTVTIASLTNGNLVAVPLDGPEGTKITLTIIPAAGYRLKEESLKYNDGGSDVSITETSFVLPAADVTVTAEFETIPADNYAVTIASLTNGNLVAVPLDGPEGTKITLTIIPAAGYRLKEESLKYNDGDSDVSITGTSFDLPAADVTVTAEFETIPAGNYAVTIAALTNGSVTAAPHYGPEGTTITLTVAPAAGYKLQEGSLKYNDGGSDVSITGTGFDLPAADVTVTAEFETVNYAVNIAALTNGSVTAAPDNGLMGTEITLTVTPASGYRLKEGSLKYNDGGSDVSITGTGFALPAADVTVTAEFEPTVPSGQIVDGGIAALTEGRFDDAIAAFESAYRQDPANRTAIIYSSLGKLTSIAKDQSIRDLMRDRLGLKDYPGTIDSLIAGDWIESYTQTGLPGIDLPAWFTETGSYTNNLTGDGTLLRSSAWPLLLFANLADKNQDGLNALLDGILSSVFGASFEDAAGRFSALSYYQFIEVDRDVIDALGMSEILEGDDLYIGKAELDLLFSAVRLVKATLEWVAAYDWNTDVSFLKADWQTIVDNIDTLTPSSLPFRNNFMKDRNNGRMIDSKNDFIRALADGVRTYDHLAGVDSELPAAYVDGLKEYAQLKDGLSKLKNAIETGGNFYVPKNFNMRERWPSGNGYANSPQNAEIGFDMGKLFTPGQFAIDQLIEMESGGRSPQFYSFSAWNDSQAQAVDTQDRMDGLDESGYVGFKLNVSRIKEVIIMGGAIDGIEELEGELPMFPARIGKDLYGLYHK
jgi:hypothetical protein